MNDRFRISSLWAQRLPEHKLALPALLRLAGLPMRKSPFNNWWKTPGANWRTIISNTVPLN
jgi:hypothetical protein